MAIRTNTKIKFIWIGILLICIIAVWVIISSQHSSSRISERKFVDVYVQLSLANDLYASDSLKLKQEKERIYQQAQITPKDMDNFVKERKEKPEQWENIWKKIMQKLESSPKMPK
jgi:amino acid permease